MKHTIKPFFRRIGNFTEEEIAAIEAHTTVESFKKGSVILAEGKVCQKCYFVLEGCLRQYQLINGEEKTNGFFLEGQPAVLYSSYLNQRPSEYYVSCIEDSVLLTGTREQEAELRKNFPSLAHLTHTLIVQDHERAEKYISLLNGYKPEDRYLVLMETQPELFNRIPLHQIASFLGITPESFSRIRKRIQNHEKLRHSL